LAVPAHQEAIAKHAGGSRRPVRGKLSAGHARQAAGLATRHAAHVRRGALKHLVQVKRGSV
jgi:hypothetical protein